MPTNTEPTETTVNNLIINTLTKAQYDALESPNPHELYLIPDTAGEDLSNHVGDTTKHITSAERQTWNNKANASHTHNASQINAGTLGAARLPNATTSVKGAVIVGSGINLSNGTISVTPYSLPTADANTLGGVKIGSSMRVDSDGTINVDSVPPATTSTLGVIKVGANLTIDNDGTLNGQVASYVPLDAVIVDNSVPDSPANDHIPSSAAVKQYIDTAIGNVENALLSL